MTSPASHASSDPADAPGPSGPAPSIPTEAGLRELMAVREIVHAFLTAERPEDVFQFALDRVGPLVGAAFACVYLADADTDLMRLAAVYNWPERYAPFLGQMRVRLGAGPSGTAASERRAIEIPDVFADESLEDWQEVARELEFRGLVALPLETRRGVLGTVAFYFTQPGPFGGETGDMLRTVAEQMAATAEKARLIGELQDANAGLAEKNAELERQFGALLEARRVKDEFLANISHELRTPLTAVLGYAELMADGVMGGPVSDEQARTLAQVRKSSDHLLTLIDDLLELTTLRQGGLEVELTDVDPRAPMHAALAAVGEAPAGVTVRMEAPDLVPHIRSDPRKIEKILRTLLANAYKFTPAGEIRVVLAVDSGKGRIEYTVHDTGIGIPAEARQYVFEEFRQVDGTSTRTRGGSGLGLALARRLARVLGGDVAITDTRLGAGSAFRVTLPLHHRER